MLKSAVGARATGLWRHPDFLKLWTGQTISIVGSQVSLLAIPTTAALVLNATPLQMGLLTMLAAAPALLFGLVVGVWTDRVRRRPILIIADCGRGLLLSLIPLASLLGLLQMDLLYILAFLAGAFSIFFNTAAGAYLPSLLAEEFLVDGNSKLALSESVGEIVGPGLAGVLIQFLTAPLAILVDALSFLISALALLWIRQPEVVPEVGPRPRRMGREILEGLRFVFGAPILRALLGSVATLALFNAMLEAVVLLYIMRDVGIPPALFGLAFALGSVGSLLGAALAGRMTRRLGLGRVLMIAPLVIGGSDLLLPFVGLTPLLVGLLLLSVGQFFFGLARPIYSINLISLRQAITPAPLRGRTSASMAVLVAGGLPIVGALLGGLLGQTLGLPLTLALAAAGEMLTSGWLFLSPVRTLDSIPSGT